MRFNQSNRQLISIFRNNTFLENYLFALARRIYFGGLQMTLQIVYEVGEFRTLIEPLEYINELLLDISLSALRSRPTD